MASITPQPRRSRRARRFDSPQQEAFLNLWRTYDRLKLLEDELFAEHQLSAQQYNALRLLGAASPEAIPTLLLAKRLISRAPDITRLVDKLEQRGFVWRERRAENRRVVCVRITDAGLAKLDELADAVRDMHKRQLGHLTATERRDLVRLLKRVRQPHEEQGHWLND